MRSVVKLVVRIFAKLVKNRANLQVSYPTVIRELKRYWIKAQKRGEPQSKYPRVDELEIGNQLTAPRPPVKQPHIVSYYRGESGWNKNFG